jgi:hypothetical protein
MRYALATFRLGEDDTGEILAASSQCGLFGSERIVWVEGIERIARLRAKEREGLFEFLKGEPANPIVLTTDELAHEFRKRSKTHAELLSRVTVVDFWGLRPEEAVRWLIHHAEQQGVRVSVAAAQRIVTHLGVDLCSLAQEIEKIRLLHGEGDLGVADLREMTRLGLMGRAWECVDAVLAGRALEALQGLQVVQREETAFSFNWKLSYGAARQLSSPDGESGARGAGEWGRRERAVAHAPLSTREKNLLGRVLMECYDWERHLKSGRWPGTHDYHALEALIIAHAARLRGAPPEGTAARRGAACRE